MFYGEYEHTIDKKGRLILPSKFREAFKEHFIERIYATRGMEKCLFVFGEDEWKQQEQKFKAMPFTKSEARKFNRLYFSGACELACDRQGRILLPGYLKEYAGIKREVVIVGLANRIEVWSKDKWKEFYESSKESYEEIAEKIIE